MNSPTATCNGCQNGDSFDLPISMAFQPIVDFAARRIFAYEALVRGVDGAGAATVLGQLTEANRYGFDQRCRTTAVTLASELGMAGTGAYLSINFLPNAVYEPRACIRLTLEAAARTGFPLDRILFEFTEQQNLDTAHVLRILRTYREIGFKTAIDDFGAGYAGLNLLSQFQPDFVKIDMELIRDIDHSTAKQKIVRNTLRLLDDLDITPICEGIETAEEYAALRDMGVALMQGYLIARPALARLPAVEWQD